MIIYKFGGASVKDAPSVLLLKNIVKQADQHLIVVVSAMGKTTNKLEKVVEKAHRGKNDYKHMLVDLLNFHLGISLELLPHKSDPVHKEIKSIFKQIEDQIEKYKDEDFDLFYDQVVSFGEILSTKIVSRYLNFEGVTNTWIDVRKLIYTDDTFRDAHVDLEYTTKQCRENLTFKNTNCYIMQGFIGSNGKLTTTLGREGSDYTAALLAFAMDADNVTLWKDVDGIFNADPAIYDKVELLESIRYQDMIELSFYGAKVIHPKTLKPLKTKTIPLFVKSFFQPAGKGTRVGEFERLKSEVPVIILLEDQILLSISNQDLSFINERHISKLFALLHKFRLKANILQHSAVSFSICVDKPRGREVEELILKLKQDFRVLYNEGLQLTTIRNYNDEIIQDVTRDRKIFVEQRSRNTVQFVTS